MRIEQAGLAAAAALIEYTSDRTEGIPPSLSDQRAQTHRRRIGYLESPGPVLAAGRRVGLEGPSFVHDAAEVVQDAANELEHVFRNVETVATTETGRPAPRWTATVPGEPMAACGRRSRGSVRPPELTVVTGAASRSDVRCKGGGRPRHTGRCETASSALWNVRTSHRGQPRCRESQRGPHVPPRRPKCVP